LKSTLALFFLMISFKIFSHTWDEPWHKEVVAGSDTFGLYEVVDNSGFSIKLNQIKHLAGENTEKEIEVSKYYLFDWTSNASDLDDHPFEYSKGQKVYAFLKKEEGQYAVATPMSGIARIMEDGSVHATYRHSLHGAKSYPQEYEILQTCIFNYLHAVECEANAEALVKEALKDPVGVLSENVSEEDVERFFSQHAALETSYLAKIQNSIGVLRPFLDSDFFHVQIGAVRALAVSNYSNKEGELLSFVASDDKDGVARVMAVLLLSEFPSENAVNFLHGYLNKAPEEEVYLGATSIMDPRVGTWYPQSVKAAVEWYLTENKALNKSIQPTANTAAD
jgi:hypothetical protein